MAIKTRAQLQSESDSTFLDNTTGAIVPENHRIYNNNVGESVANLKDDNLFEGENSFLQPIYSNVGGGMAALTSGEGGILLTNGGVQLTNGNLEIGGQSTLSGLLQSDGGANFTDKVTMTAQFVTNQVATPITAASNIDLTDVEGNVIFIDNPTNLEISSFQGVVGSIFYATFYQDCILNCLSGASIQPNQNIAIKGGDTLIFKFENASLIRVFGLKRYAGDYFPVINKEAFIELMNNSALQIGAWYRINGGYEVLGTSADVLVFAAEPPYFDLNRTYIRVYSKWYLCKADDFTLDAGTIPFSVQTDYADIIGLTELDTNEAAPQWKIGSGAVLGNLPQADFVGNTFFDVDNRGLKRNLLNYYNKDKPYFGRILYSGFHDQMRFYPHSGNQLQWGNLAIRFFEDGIYTTNLQAFNIDDNGHPSIVINQVTAQYSVVNDTCTINFLVQCEGKFSYGDAGHSFLLYFPLPFSGVGDYLLGMGSGVIRQQDVNNHEDIGGIVTILNEYTCLFEAKWSSTLAVSNNCLISANFTYTIEGEI